MKTVTEHIRDSLLAHVIKAPVGHKAESLAELRITQWSSAFEALMRNHLIMGRFRYDRMVRAKRHKYQRMESIFYRLRQYQETGNLEHLVDVANLCLLEFEHSDHPNRHFRSTDDNTHVVPARRGK